MHFTEDMFEQAVIELRKITAADNAAFIGAETVSFDIIDTGKELVAEGYIDTGKNTDLKIDLIDQSVPADTSRVIGVRENNAVVHKRLNDLPHRYNGCTATPCKLRDRHALLFQQAGKNIQFVYLANIGDRQLFMLHNSIIVTQ